MMTQTYTFPLIVVERPHRRPAKAWVANSAADLTAGSCGDNWGFETFDSLQKLRDTYGPEVDWPEALREACPKAADFPAAFATSPYGDEFTPNVTSDLAETLRLEHAIAELGHDLYALDLLESREEAERFVKQRGHNIPYKQVQECMVALGWAGEDEEDEEDEEGEEEVA